MRPLPTGPFAPPMIPGGLNTLTIIVLLLTLWHASHVLGVRRTLAFFAITAVTSWLFEEVGVTTGLVYGPYHYTSTLGPWLGSVPFLIPLAWFVLVYTSYGLANLIADRLPSGLAGGRRPLISLVLLGAVVITALDLIVDPILSGPSFRAWVWDTAGPYYGVPIQNYVGWIATASLVHLLWRSLERWAIAQLSTSNAGLLLAEPRSDVAQWVDLRLGSKSPAMRDF
jgi:putative membrane protein